VNKAGAILEKKRFKKCIFGLQGGWGWGKLTLQAANLAAGWSHHTPHPHSP
jgi:hypothetical protein